MNRWTVVRGLLGLVAVGAAVRAIASQWEAVKGHSIPWAPSPPWLILAGAAALGGYAVLILGWRWTLGRLGQAIPVRGAANVWLLANLGKYLPGKAWTFAGSAVLARDHAVDPLRAFSAAVIMQLGSFAAAAVLVPLDSSAFTRLVAPTTLGILRALSVLFLLGCVAVAIPRTANALGTRLPARLAGMLPVPWTLQLGALVANLTGWILLGVSFAALGRGIAPVTHLPWDAALSPFVLSYLAGFVALIAPGGIGVRESVLVVLLDARIGPEAAIALAIASRVLLTMVDLLGGALGIALSPRSSRSFPARRG